MSGRFRVPVMECLPSRYDGGLLITDTGINERGENERQSEIDSEMKV